MNIYIYIRSDVSAAWNNTKCLNLPYKLQVKPSKQDASGNKERRPKAACKMTYMCEPWILTQHVK